jgi:hypothetical protein
VLLQGQVELRFWWRVAHEFWCKMSSQAQVSGILVQLCNCSFHPEQLRPFEAMDTPAGESPSSTNTPRQLWSHAVSEHDESNQTRAAVQPAAS